MTAENEKITIVTSERSPVRIVPTMPWPIIARADWHDGVHECECQANTRRIIVVHEHADGRRNVCGWQSADPGRQPLGARNLIHGFLVSAGDACNEETIRAIRRVGDILNDSDLADRCIADLPACHLSAEEDALMTAWAKLKAAEEDVDEAIEEIVSAVREEATEELEALDAEVKVCKVAREAARNALRAAENAWAADVRARAEKKPE